MINAIYHHKGWFFTTLLSILIFFAHTISAICPCLLGADVCNINYFDDSQSLIEIFFIGSVFAPLLETAIFQMAPIVAYSKFVQQKTKGKRLAITFSSALIFGLTHNYNFLAVVNACFAGVIFASVYFYFEGQNSQGFRYTFLIHALYNTYAFLIDDVLKLG